MPCSLSGSGWPADAASRGNGLFNYRSLTRADLPALHALLLSAARADQDEHVETLEELETQFDDAWSDPAVDAVVADDVDGRLCLYARLFVNPEPNPERTSFGTYAVHPDRRGSGHEDALLDWLEARANNHRPPDHEGVTDVRLRIARRERQTTEIERLSRRGYRHIRDYFRMRRSLDDALPQAVYPSGVEIRPFSAGDDEALWSAHLEAFSDHWGYQLESLVDFRQYVIASADFRPDLTRLVWAGGQVVAYSINQVAAADNDRMGRAEGTIRLLGTRRAWRGKGLARAMLCDSLRRFKDVGLTHAALTVDAENLTGALGLYQRIGFSVAVRTLAFDLLLPQN